MNKTEWQKQNTVMISMRLQKATDRDILEWLEKQTGKQGPIKQAIRYYIESETQTEQKTE